MEANTNRDPEADNKPSFSYGGGARQPDDVRGLKEAIDRFIARAGRETIPKMAESHYADDVAPNTARYEGLGDLYKPLPKPDERTYQKILHGIHRWADLELFVREALRNAKGEEAVEVEIELYNFRALEVPKAFLARAAKLAARYPGHPLTLVAHGDPIDLPFVYRFDGQGVHASSNEKNEQAIAFWGEAPLDPSKIFRAGDNEPAEVYQHRLLDRALRDTASAPAEERPMDRGVFLSGVLENYNRLAKEWNARQGKGLPAVALIKDNRRTEIDARIQGLINHYRARAKEIAEERGLDVPAGALWWDPVTTTLRNYPINDRPENHLVVVGGGAMGAAMAEIVRRRIDRGLLPLDFRVTVVETAPALNWEIHTEGTNTYAFGKDRPVNPPARRAFYYTPVPAEEVMNRRGADVVVEATKAGDFVKDKKRKESAEGLARHSPAMLSPTKSFVPGSLIPYLEVYDYYVSLGYPDLAASQLVFGGYVSAPDVFGDLEVYPVIAGESPEAVAKAKRIFGEEGIEYLVGKEWAVFVQMAGAMKNPATYWATYGIASRVFGEQTPTYSELNPLLEKAKEDNVRLVEETIARIAPEVGLETEGLSSPYGVKMDIQKCLPPDLEALFEIRKRFNDEVLATGNIAALDNIIKDIIGKRYRHRLGTRNAMDGALDALIASAYSRLKPDVTFAQFYDDHYPADWKKSPQEGRNGVDHLMAFADEHCLSLPGWVYEAWNLYHAKEIREGKMAEKVVAPVPVQVFPATISAGHAEGAPLLASAGSESAAMAAPSDGATAGAKLLGIGGLVFVLQGNPLSDLMAEQIVAGPSSLGPVAVYEPPVGLAPAFSAVAKPAVYSPFNSAGAFSIQSPSLGVWGADPAWGATSASILAAVPSLIVSAPGAVAPGISFAPMPAFVP
ncbi:MAG: hypothetical protein HYU99_08130 [Deltaproteobacteria bacterium]|nr:hypothetical protein [Deltaproteobacteria bacterium]